MRLLRTPEEQRIVERLPDALIGHGVVPLAIDPDVTDAPDVVVRHAGGLLGLEITRLDYEAYCKWLADPPETGYSRVAEVTVNLRKLLSTVVRKKRAKYAKYMHERALSECWLVLHNDVFDFPESTAPDRPDRRWFEQHSAWELTDQQCPFERVLFNLEHPSKWYSLFCRGSSSPRTSVMHRWPTVIRREAAAITSRGVNIFDLRSKPGITFE